MSNNQKSSPNDISESSKKLSIEDARGLTSGDIIQIQQEIQKTASRVSGYRVESFYKKTGSHQYNEITGFKREIEAIHHVIELGDHIKNIPQKEILKLPPKMLMDIANQYTNLDNSLRQMRNFHEESSIDDFDAYVDEETKRDKGWLLDGFYKNLEIFKRVSDPLIGVSNFIEIDVLRDQVNKLTDAQTKQGIEKHHDLFSKNAKRHHVAGWFWLVVGAGLAMAAWLFGVSMIEKIEGFSIEEANNLSDIHFGLIFARIFMFGFLGSLIFWTFKNYRLNKHNELLNKQKALSLQTFTEFSNSAGTDADMRRAVLARVTATIFDTPDMGYIKREAVSSNDVDILNTLANVIGNKE